MKCKNTLFPILFLIIFFVILFFAPHENTRKGIFIITCSLGVLFFVMKTILFVINKTIAEKETIKEKYAIPVAAYTYMGFSIFFIAFFIYRIYDNDFPCELSTIINLPEKNWMYYNLLSSTTYLVITAFLWNFSKSFFTINVLEYDIKELDPIELDSLKLENTRSTGMIGEIIIRMIVATFFILTEQHLCYFNFEENGLLNKINIFAIFTIILYIFLLIWFIYSNIIFGKNGSFLNSIGKKWAIQFYMGLLLSFFLFYLGIGNLPILKPAVNVIVGCVFYVVPSFIMCFLLIRLEIESLEKLKKIFKK